MYPKIDELSNVLFLVLRRNRCHLQEDEREHREHDCLNEANKDFEEEKREREEIGHEMKHDREEHFPRKDIPEETKREGDRFCIDVVFFLFNLLISFKNNHEQITEFFERILGRSY